MEYTTTDIKETIVYYALYKSNEKIKCISRTYYGYHTGGKFEYAYKHEYIPIIEN